MGWAKYLEDIASRHNGTSLVQRQLGVEGGRNPRPHGPAVPRLHEQGEENRRCRN